MIKSCSGLSKAGRRLGIMDTKLQLKIVVCLSMLLLSTMFERNLVSIVIEVPAQLTVA